MIQSPSKFQALFYCLGSASDFFGFGQDIPRTLAPWRFLSHTGGHGQDSGFRLQGWAYFTYVWTWRATGNYSESKMPRGRKKIWRLGKKEPQKWATLFYVEVSPTCDTTTARLLKPNTRCHGSNGTRISSKSTSVFTVSFVGNMLSVNATWR